MLDLAVARGQVFSASADGKVRQHDLKSSRLVRAFEGLDDWAYSLAVDPAGNRLAVGGFDGGVRVYDHRERPRGRPVRRRSRVDPAVKVVAAGELDGYDRPRTCPS